MQVSGFIGLFANAATLNGPTFAGNVLANNLISSDGHLTIACGRLLSAEAQVTLIDDIISIGCAGTIVTPEGVLGTPVVTGPGGGGGNVGGSSGFNGGQAVPEPATLLLFGLGLAGLFTFRKRLFPVA